MSNAEAEAPRVAEQVGAKRQTSDARSAIERNRAGEAFLTLSSGKQPKRVTVRKFKGMTLVDLREYYSKDGEYLPGKKGISLTVAQYEALKGAMEKIDAEIDRLSG
jgi:hypothetical protein